MHLYEHLDHTKCTQFYNLLLKLYESSPHCKRTFKTVIDGKKGKMVMADYKTRGVIKRYSRTQRFHMISNQLVGLITKFLVPNFSS
jgi:hypothetical protein